METEVNTNRKINYKILIGVIVALLLLGLGFYLYYYYPQIIPGMASLSPELNEDVNMLIIGLDDTDSVAWGKINPDSIVLIKLQPKEDKVKVINLELEEEINYDQEPNDEDMNTLVSKVSEITSTDINYYFSLSYQGFENMVDNLDGIEIELEESLKISDLELDLVASKNTLSGKEALNYVRWYDYRTDKTERLVRQQQVLKAIIDEAYTAKTLLDLPQLFQTTVDTYKMVNTNINYTLITEIVEYLKDNQNIKIDYEIIK